MFFPSVKALPNLGRLSFTDAIMQLVILHDDLRNLQKPNEANEVHAHSQGVQALLRK
jgi:hypothetical protein